MDVIKLEAKKFVDNLLGDEACEKPIEPLKRDGDLELPEWFDEDKFNRGRQFARRNFYAFVISYTYGLMLLFSLPSILRVLIVSKKSSSTMTAYRRYLSTYMHIFAWLIYDLKPNSVSWCSIKEVRVRHWQASKIAKLNNRGLVSQRDSGITLFIFTGLAVLKPEKFGITGQSNEDWDAYIHTFRVLGYLNGVSDRYNMCRKNYEDTYAICQEVQNRVFTPCMENVAEYFEHMARVSLDGLQSVLPMFHPTASLYLCRYFTDVPGYVYTKEDRMNLQKKLRQKLKEEGKPLSEGVDVQTLISAPSIDGLPSLPPRFLYVEDYDSLETVPSYRILSFTAKCQVFLNIWLLHLNSIYFIRILLNFFINFAVLLAKYFPIIAFFRFGVKLSYVDMNKHDITDDTKPKTNLEYYEIDHANLRI